MDNEPVSKVALSASKKKRGDMCGQRVDGNSVLSAQFRCDPISALKHEVH